MHTPRTAERRSARQLNSGETDRLVERYLEVRNIREIARELKLSRTTVAKHLASRAVMTSRSMNPAQEQLANELYNDGLSSAAIGRQLGFDNKTVLRAIAPDAVRHK